ncbi:YceI family protein [Lacihabitans lacunae]|uniref:YceI family protein n=1 Tax=Lacihabitans lacunae TaxID=1028214 RepID=A0ABV7Z1Z7_9BACT
MKKLSLVAAIAAVVSLSAFTFISSVNWKIADNHSVTFKGTDAEGVFKTMSGNISFDENDLANSKFAVSLDVASINTGNGMKNKHAKSDKWFDAEKYPKITFTSNKFTKTAAGYSVEGTLDLHGVKKPISIPFTFASNTFKGSLKVNRMDYGVGTMQGMSKKVSNEIVVDISVPVTK